MDEPNDTTKATDGPDKSELIRDAVVFQFKLLVDGVRDFVLIPVSLGAAILSFLKPGAKAGTEFYDVVAFGRETERKINLFSAADKIETGPVADDLPDLDALIGEIETMAKREYAGERFAPARERLARLRQSMRDRTEDRNASPPDQDPPPDQD